MGKSKLEKFYEPAVLYPFMRWPDVATGRVQERHRETKCVVLTGPRETVNSCLEGAKGGENQGVCSARQLGT